MSFYISLSGLRNAQTDLGTIAHNIANADTTGFKRSRASFADIVASSAASDPTQTRGVGATVERIEQQFSLGPVEQTGAALDVAITGDGFFTLKGAASGQTLFTRNGNLSIDGSGYIQDGQNNRLQLFPTDAMGTISSTTPVDAQVPATNAAGSEYAGVTIGNDGAVSASYADGTSMVVGKIALAGFVAPTGLKQVGSSNWQATGISGSPTYGAPSQGRFGALLSGALERSNVDIAEELVGLITAQRNFQANAKAIDAASQLTQTVINLRT